MEHVSNQVTLSQVRQDLRIPGFTLVPGHADPKQVWADPWVAHDRHVYCGPAEVLVQRKPVEVEHPCGGGVRIQVEPHTLDGAQRGLPPRRER